MLIPGQFSVSPSFLSDFPLRELSCCTHLRSRHPHEDTQDRYMESPGWWQTPSEGHLTSTRDGILHPGPLGPAEQSLQGPILHWLNAGDTQRTPSVQEYGILKEPEYLSQPGLIEGEGGWWGGSTVYLLELGEGVEDVLQQGYLFLNIR